MGLIDKKNILPNVESIPQLELELGCGNRKRSRQAIGVDMLDYPDVDIVGDVYEALALFPAQSVHAVYSYHFVEHVPDVPRLLFELARIVKPGGYVEFVAPHFSNSYFYSDPTHRSFFGLYTFCYFADQSIFARQVPTYGYKADFKLAEVDLVFKSTRPFFIRHGIRKVLGFFFNSSNFMKEMYEENFCYLLSCYEVKYKLRRHRLDT
jgi:SAM-dependent methyltransferase